MRSAEEKRFLAELQRAEREKGAGFPGQEPCPLVRRVIRFMGEEYGMSVGRCLTLLRRFEEGGLYERERDCSGPGWATAQGLDMGHLSQAGALYCPSARVRADQVSPIVCLQYCPEGGCGGVGLCQFDKETLCRHGALLGDEACRIDP